MNLSPIKRRNVLQGMAALGSTGLLGTALAQTGKAAWPTKPIRLVVPFNAGGATDIIARTVGEALSKRIGQPVVVDNKGGAAGILGTDAVAKAAPDGYTIVQSGVGQNAVAHGLDPKLAYDSMRDFVHISQVHSGPNVLVVTLIGWQVAGLAGALTATVAMCLPMSVVVYLLFGHWDRFKGARWQRAIQLGGVYDGHEMPEDLNPLTKSSVKALAGTGLIGVAKDNLPRGGEVGASGADDVWHLRA